MKRHFHAQVGWSGPCWPKPFHSADLPPPNVFCSIWLSVLVWVLSGLESLLPCKSCLTKATYIEQVSSHVSLWCNNALSFFVVNFSLHDKCFINLRRSANSELVSCKLILDKTFPINRKNKNKILHKWFNILNHSSHNLFLNSLLPSWWLLYCQNESKTVIHLSIILDRERLNNIFQIDETILSIT